MGSTRLKVDRFYFHAITIQRNSSLTVCIQVRKCIFVMQKNDILDEYAGFIWFQRQADEPCCTAHPMVKISPVFSSSMVLSGSILYLYVAGFVDDHRAIWRINASVFSC